MLRPQARFPGLVFHLVKLADAGEDFHRQRIVGRQFGGLDKAAPEMGHASDIDDAFAQFVINPIAVALQLARKSPQKSLRPFAPAPHLKVKDDRSSGLAKLPEVSLMVAPGFFPRLHRDRGFIGLQIGTADQLDGLRPNHRAQQLSGSQEAVGHRFAAQLHVIIVRQDGALTIDRQVLLELLGQRFDDKFVREFALGHDLGRGRRGGHPLLFQTMGAALLPLGYAHVKGGRLAHQFLAALVADDRSARPRIGRNGSLGDGRG